MAGKSATRVADAAQAAGLVINVLTMPQSTRTAQEAAAACGCDAAQIVKSLIFRKAGAGELVLLLIAGDRQADLAAAGRAAGAPLERADAKLVREVTGFAIGGVAPIGHLTPIPVFMDPALLEHDVVWAAAGTPDNMFAVDPEALRRAVSARMLPAAG